MRTIQKLRNIVRLKTASRVPTITGSCGNHKQTAAKPKVFKWEIPLTDLKKTAEGF